MRPEIDAESPPNGPDKGKGKGKAPALHVPSETTPLLPSGSSTFISSTPDQTRNRLVSKLLRVFFISLCVCVAILIFVVLIAWSYAARVSHISPDHVLNSAMQFQGPDRINVLNVTESGGIWVTIDGRVGLDAGRALGLNTNDGDSLFSEIWKSFGRWGIRRVDRLAIDLDYVELVSDEGCLLATLDLPPVEVVLTVDPPYDSSWLQHVSTTVYLQPTQNTSDIVSYFGEAWRRGKAIINVHVGSVRVQGGRIGSHSWRDRIQEEFNDIKTYFVLKIPQLPGLPQPGRNIPFPPLSDLMTLETFSLSTVGDQLSISGRASIVDPAPLTINITVPSLPFVISLQPGVHIAAVNTASFTTTHPNITLLITGSVLPVPSDSTDILSTFLSRYLSALPNPIILSTPLIPKLDLDAEFPAPHPQPRVLRNVTIHDMKLKAGNTFLASGTVFARVVLPQGMDIDVDVTHVLPDVLVFDGEVPDYIAGPGTPPDTPPFPDPLPERAFAHIRPDDWLDSDCVRIPLEPGEEGGSAFEVTAKIDDVPLEVLPGRQNEFSNFVRKVVFGTDGAVAGLLGIVAVSVDVPGLPVGNGEALRLDGLPFKGSVKIGKKNMLRVGF